MKTKAKPESPVQGGEHADSSTWGNRSGWWPVIVEDTGESGYVQESEITSVPKED